MTAHIEQMTLAILLLVVAMVVSLVIVGIVQGIAVYYMRKGVKATPNSNITAYKGMQILAPVNMCVELVLEHPTVV